jgi:hypothetical protein
MRVNWWGALVLGLGITAMLMNWGSYYDGSNWQNGSLFELLGRSGNLAITAWLGLFFISTLVTVRTTWGGVGQVLSSVLVLVSSRESLSSPAETVGVIGMPIGPIIGLLVGLVEVYMLFGMDWAYVVVDDSEVPRSAGSSPYIKTRKSIWSRR